MDVSPDLASDAGFVKGVVSVDMVVVVADVGFAFVVVIVADEDKDGDIDDIIFIGEFSDDVSWLEYVGKTEE